MKEVVAGILYHNDKILLAQRSIGQKLEGKWEFPGGKIEQLPNKPLLERYVKNFPLLSKI
ncbi:NUDIX domain-containing protein [Alkalibaculum sporogenes]|uniref:NUDIX domain-containing protein n=1 Tax=Alkalibaculum sporogenes TaxID=2655001 RepID=UPI0031B63F94